MLILVPTWREVVCAVHASYIGSRLTQLWVVKSSQLCIFILHSSPQKVVTSNPQIQSSLFVCVIPQSLCKQCWVGCPILGDGLSYGIITESINRSYIGAGMGSVYQEFVCYVRPLYKDHREKFDMTKRKLECCIILMETMYLLGPKHVGSFAEQALLGVGFVHACPA